MTITTLCSKSKSQNFYNYVFFYSFRIYKPISKKYKMLLYLAIFSLTSIIDLK